MALYEAQLRLWRTKKVGPSVVGQSLFGSPCRILFFFFLEKTPSLNQSGPARRYHSPVVTLGSDYDIGCSFRWKY